MMGFNPKTRVSDFLLIGFYRFLKSFKYSYSEYAFLDVYCRKLYHGGDERTHHCFLGYLRELEEQYFLEQDSKYPNEKMRHYAHPSHYIKPEHITHFIELLDIHFNINEKVDFPEFENTSVIQELLSLTDNERKVLNYCLFIQEARDKYYYAMEILDEGKFIYSDNVNEYLTRMFNISTKEVEELKNSFLFSFVLEYDQRKGYYVINNDLCQLFTLPGLTFEIITDRLFPSPINTELTVDLYPHIATEIVRTENIINSALVGKKHGINTLFWGFPGTGKTELTLVLAKKNNWDLKVVGDMSMTTMTEQSRKSRLASLRIALKLFENQPNVVLLFDEMEDLFKIDMSASQSKAFINRIIETTTIPIIWTTNDLLSLGSAVLRRMIYNIEFDIPPESARHVMWKSYAEKYNVELDDDFINRLSRDYKVFPATIANTLKIVSMAGLPTAEMDEVIQSIYKLINYGKAMKSNPAKHKKEFYDTSYINCEKDIVEFTERLLKAKPNFSMALYGPPGTGKSEYGRYLAERMGLTVVFKRASDLISPYLGETEQNLAKAFEEARVEKSVLIIDEGDSFLQDREKAVRSWEIQQVNEMLSQMESNEYPFILTTNLMDNLDPAALRRFTFKLKFNFLRSTQTEGLFKTYFNMEAPSKLSRLELLSPGDFANVKKQVDILGIDNPEEIYNMLNDECSLKTGYRKESPGFLN